MPKSTRSALPTLERKPGGPDNWVERVGGLPQYIDRIARHLHYDRGMTISHAIATAVNTVKRWAKKGTVVKWRDPHNNHVTTITAAQAAADVASWEAKKAAARGTGGGGTRSGRIRTRSARLSMEDSVNATATKVVKVVDLTYPLGGPGMKVRKKLVKQGKAMPNASSGGGFPINDIGDLKKAIRSIGRAKDPAAAKRHIIRRARALGASNLIPKQWSASLSIPIKKIEVIDLAYEKMKPQDKTAADAMKSQAQATIKKLGPLLGEVADPRVLRAMVSQIQQATDCLNQCRWWSEGDMASLSLDLALTKDGRRSYKKQGKWKHGFIPADPKAVESKAKGSPIATKRITRLYGSPSKADAASRAAVKRTLALRHAKTGTAAKAAEESVKVRAIGGSKTSRDFERAGSAAQLQRADVKDTKAQHRVKPKTQKEVGRGRAATSRATKAWDSIPENQRTIRNGKRYVVVNFHGQQLVTEWVGPNGPSTTSDASTRGRREIQTQALENMSTATLRRMLKKADLSPQVRKKVNKALRAAIAKQKKREKK